MTGHAPPSAHLVGVCGSGMKALAELLLDSGWTVTGSDLSRPGAAIERLIERGLTFHQHHQPTNIPTSTTHVVFSPAVPEHNVERHEALRRSIPQFSYSQMVAQFMDRSTGVCIAGTHGKSTTTAMTAWILDAGRRLDGVVIGAELCENGRSGWTSTGDLFVAESCEFRQSFFDFSPRFAAILSVEPDHFDCYPDLASLEAAFCEFANHLPDDGLLLTNLDCPTSTEVATKSTTGARRVTFGFASQANWQAVDIQSASDGVRFHLLHDDQYATEIQLALHGLHNAGNALAAAALCAEVGVALTVIRDSLASFRGIRRRLEFVGDWNGVTFVDDYAHHPTAVNVTLDTLRQVVGSRRIWCIFQPHQILRTTTLMDQFASSFSSADQVIVAPVFAAREASSDQPQQVSQELAGRIRLRGVPAECLPTLDQIVSTLDDAMRPGDVIVTMGAGDIDRIYHEFTRRIQ